MQGGMFCGADPQLFRGKVRRCVFHCVLSLPPNWAISKPHSRLSQLKSAHGAGFLPTLNRFQSAKTSNQFLNFAKGLSGFEMAALAFSFTTNILSSTAGKASGSACRPIASALIF
jgi:hypothetical protein